jgi:Domain of unknown function (DUF4262)
MCEGFSLDDVLALDAAHIAEYGFINIGVDVEPPAGPWAYTVGLLDAAGHPELIVAGAPLARCGPILATLARAVLDDDERFEVGDRIALGRGDAVIGSVHDIQYVLETFNFWHNLADYGAIRSPALEAVQVLLPRGFFCADHRGAQPVLSDREARVGQRPANLTVRRRGPRGSA